MNLKLKPRIPYYFNAEPILEADPALKIAIQKIIANLIMETNLSKLFIWYHFSS